MNDVAQHLSQTILQHLQSYSSSMHHQLQHVMDQHHQLCCIYTVPGRKSPLQLLSITTLTLNWLYKYFTHSSTLLKLCYIILNNLSLSFTGKLTGLLTFGVINLLLQTLHSCEWPMFIGGGGILQAISSYHTSFLDTIFYQFCHLFTTLCKFYCVFFSVNKVWFHINVIAKLSVHNLDDGLNFRFWLPQ